MATIMRAKQDERIQTIISHSKTTIKKKCVHNKVRIEIEKKKKWLNPNYVLDATTKDIRSIDNEIGYETIDVCRLLKTNGPI